MWEGLAPDSHRYLHNFGATPHLWRGANAYLPDAPRSKCGRGLAPDGGLWADQDVGSD